MRSSIPDPDAGRPDAVRPQGAAPADWRARLISRVSPLADGVVPLEVRRWQKPGEFVERPRRTAAVLVGVLDRDKPELLLTRRAAHLANHGGQVSFPGGAADRDDPSGVSTALREAREEIGLQPRLVQPVGFLNRIDTPTDFRILPVVGLVHQAPPFDPDPAEVEEVFTVPLAVTLDASAWERREVEHQGVRRVVHSLHWGRHLIWGATAAIVLDLAQRLAGGTLIHPHGGRPGGNVR